MISFDMGKMYTSRMNINSFSILSSVLFDGLNDIKCLDPVN